MKQLLLVSTAFVCFAVSAQARADAAPPSGTPELGAPLAGTDIIVTARRRDESLSKVPISISVLSSDALQKQGIRSQLDLQSAVPGLLIQQAGNSNLVNYSIRGQTIDQNTSSPPAVLPYINEFQVDGSSTGAFFDLANVQVLKGPQGTLFGRNTTGGAVLYTTVQPDDKLTGFASARVGNFDERQVQFGLTLPLTPALSFRLAGNYSDGGAFVKNLGSYTGVGGIGGLFVPASNKLGDGKNKSLRGTLSFKPSDNISNTITAQYSKDGGTSAPGFLFSYQAPSLASPFLSGQAGPFAGLADYLAWQKRTNSESYVNNDYSFYSRNFFVSNATTINLNDNLVVKNIVGYSHFNRNYSFDADGTPFHIFETPNGFPAANTIHTQFSEELQLQGKALDGRLQFTTGLYYSYLRDTHDDHILVYGIIPNTSAYGLVDRSYAGFVQATYNLTDKLHLTGGIRYTKEDVDGSQLPDNNYYNPSPPFERNQAASFKKPSWNASIDYQVNPSLLLYVTQRGSWRAGGFNFASPTLPGTAAVGGNLFLPETTKDLEGGAKFNGRIGDMPVTANLNVYRQWVSNIQRANFFVFSGIPTILTVNVPKAQITGEELSITTRIASWLSLGGQISHLDAKFTSPVVLALGTAIPYGPYGFAPKWSGSLNAEISRPVADGGSITLRGDVFAQSSFYFSNEGNSVQPNTKISGYALVNGNLSWTNVRDSGLTLSIYAKNILNKIYYTGGAATAVATGTNVVAPGRPRSYGLEMRYSF